MTFSIYLDENIWKSPIGGKERWLVVVKKHHLLRQPKAHQVYVHSVFVWVKREINICHKQCDLRADNSVQYEPLKQISIQLRISGFQLSFN